MSEQAREGEERQMGNEPVVDDLDRDDRAVLVGDEELVGGLPGATGDGKDSDSAMSRSRVLNEKEETKKRKTDGLKLLLNTPVLCASSFWPPMKSLAKGLMAVEVRVLEPSSSLAWWIVRRTMPVRVSGTSSKVPSGSLLGFRTG